MRGLLQRLARAVHEDVDPAELLERGIAQGVDRGALGDVRRLAQGLAAEALDLTRHLLETVRPTSGRDDVRPGLREPERERSPEARRSADHDRYPAVQIKTLVAHGPSSSLTESNRLR